MPTFLQLNGRAFTFNALLTALMTVLLVVGARAINQGKQDAELATSLNASGGVSLACLLKKPADDDTLFAVAAFGGGTRAALFTTAILEGVASRGKLANVVLASGISG